jgi:hypothetical protein
MRAPLDGTFVSSPTLVFGDDQRLEAVLAHLSAGNEVAPGQ